MILKRLLLCLLTVSLCVAGLSMVGSAQGVIDSYIRELETAIDDARKAYLLTDYDTLDSYLTQLEELKAEYLQATDTNEKSKLLEQAKALKTEALYARTESRYVEFRGCWVRPTQKSKSEVNRFVQDLYDRGINTICLETLYDSTLIFPAPPGSDFEHNPLFNGFDVLGAFVEECHARQMELHVWMPVFYNTHTGSEHIKKSVWYKNPEWRSINNSGKDEPVRDGTTHRYLNPAHPEVQAFLLETYRYILETYDIDGFEMDYIRYRERGGDDYGYDALTVEGFREKYGVTPVYDERASYWKDWVQYRCDFVTDFVRQMRALVDRVAPDVLLCADVMSEFTAKDSHYQDYVLWAEKGWIDLLKPMTYSEGAIKRLNQHVTLMDGKYVAAGVASYDGGYSNQAIANHVIMTTENGADGVMFFESVAFLRDHDEQYLIGTGAFRNRAVTPTMDPGRAAILALAYARDRLNNVIRPLGGMTVKQCSDLEGEFKAMEALLKNGDKEALLQKAEKTLATLGDSKAEAVLKNDLQYFCRIVTNAKKPLSDSYPIKDGMILDVSPETTAESFLKRLGWEAKVLTAKGEERPSHSHMASGDTVVAGAIRYAVVVKGDVNKDGKVNTADYVLLKRHVMGTFRIEGIALQSALLSGGKTVRTMDYVLLKRHVMGLTVL